MLHRLAGSALALTLVSPTLAQFGQVQELDPGGLSPGDHYGISAASSHDWVVIGATGDDDQGQEAGALYLFTQPGGVFSKKLTATGGVAGDLLGGSVASDRDLVAAGMHTTSTNVRSVWVFDAVSGNQLFELQAPVPAADDGFGESVAVSDPFVLVGAPGDDDVAVDSGATYVFDADTGALLAKNKAETPTAGAQFGFDVALDGNIAVVGAPGQFNGSEGQVHLFDLTVDQFLGTIDSPCACLGGFGTNVAVYLPEIAVQSPGDERIHVFHINDGLQFELVPQGPGAGFGYGLAMHGSRIGVGLADGLGIGSGWVYSADDGRLIDEVTPEDVVTGDVYANAAAMNVWGFIAGAANHDGTGMAFHFAYDGCPVDRYCSPAVHNSTGFASLIDIDTCTLGGPVLVRADDLPQFQFGYLLLGNGEDVIVAPGNSVGNLCLGGSFIGRYDDDVQSTGVEGVLVTDLVNGVTGGGVGKLPPPFGGNLIPGQTWNFQYWYRDVPSTSNFTDAITVMLD